MPEKRPTLEKLSEQLATLSEEVHVLRHDSLTTRSVAPYSGQLRLSLVRARNAFKRLGHGCVALSGFTFVAFLAALFNGKLWLLTGFVTIAAALFLGMVGYIFYLQADTLDLGDNDDR